MTDVSRETSQQMLCRLTREAARDAVIKETRDVFWGDSAKFWALIEKNKRASDSS